MKKQLCRFGLLVAASAAVSAAPTAAQAQFVTYCSGVGGAVTVPGDLVVRAGDQCMLENTVVEGNVRIGKDADLVTSGADLKGSVTVREAGFFDAEETTVTKRIAATSAYGTYLRGSSVAGSYVGKTTKDEAPEESDEPFVFFESGTKIKNVTVDGGELSLDSSEARGSVTARQGSYVDVLNATVGKRLEVENAQDGVTVCDSEVYGVATVTGSGGAVQIGGPGELGDCEGANFFGRDLNISDNTGGVSVVGNVIPGWLQGDGNNPAPTGYGNRVRGGTGGQFKDLQPAPEQGQQAAQAAGDDDAKAGAETRRAEAVAAARAAGRGF